MGLLASSVNYFANLQEASPYCIISTHYTEILEFKVFETNY